MIATVLPLAAAANAALLALALTYRSWRKRSAAGLYAAAFLAAAALAVGLIALDHAGVIADSRVSAFMEGTLTLASGPLLVLFVAALLGARTRAGQGFWLLGAYVLACAVRPLWAMDSYTVERFVLIQMGFTAWAGALVAAYAPTGRRAAGARALAAGAVIAMTALHIAQLSRLLFPNIQVLAEAVPFAGAAAFLAATGAVYFGGRISALDPLTSAPPPATPEARALVGALDRALFGGLLRRPDLTLAQAAMVVEAAPETLSRAIAAVHGKDFGEHLQARRVEAARRLLSDPAERRTSMEAIGLLAGFGSRSAFYKAFRDQTGASPAAYRAASGQNPVQTAGSGH